MAPENGLPVAAYNAEMPSTEDDKDEYLLGLIEELEELRQQKDVRIMLDEQYNIK
jgi:hypothetical protein